MSWFKDLFYGPGNLHMDEGRVVIWLAIMLMGFAALWNSLVMHQAIDLAALGGSLAGIITAGAAILAAKQWAATQFQVGQSLKAKRLGVMKDEGDAL